MLNLRYAPAFISTFTVFPSAILLAGTFTKNFSPEENFVCLFPLTLVIIVPDGALVTLTVYLSVIFLALASIYFET